MTTTVPTTLDEVRAEQERLEQVRLDLLRARFNELIAQRDAIDAELLVLADEIHGYGTPTTRRRRSRHEVPECGTESGYQRHRHRGETCDPCKAAHAEHQRINEARRKLARLTDGRVPA